MTPVDISMAVMNRATNEPKREWLFKVPKAYLRNKKTWNGGRFSALLVEMALPDLRPQKYSFTIFAKDKGTPRYNKLMKKRNQGISIKLSAREVGKDYRNNVQNRYNKRYVRQPENQYGLARYLLKSVCEEDVKPDDTVKDKCVDDGKEYFISETVNKEPWVQIKCSRPEQISGGCYARSIFNNMSISYQFRKKNLKNWQEYDQAVKTLLESFFVEKIEYENN
jgi:hypothetical protein